MLKAREKHILYWMQDEDGLRNFGDFVSELIAENVVGAANIEAGSFRVIGSCIATWLIQDDLSKLGNDVERRVAYWCCGMRDEKPIDSAELESCRICGIRGPLSRDALHLPLDTTIGDTGLLLPLIYRPKRCPRTVGKTICVPHANDKRPARDLQRMSESDVVISPWVEPSLEALRLKIDEIASSKFVLAASLHAAIVAHAYHRPFAFWENGVLDLPFKWRDFAASINIPTLFVRNISEGVIAYQNLLRTNLRWLPLEPILTVSPFAISGDLVKKARSYDAKNAFLSTAGKFADGEMVGIIEKALYSKA